MEEVEIIDISPDPLAHLLEMECTPKWAAPKCDEDTNKIISEAEYILNHTDMYSAIDSEKRWWVIKELCGFAICFNHKINKQHRKKMHELILSTGRECIDPLLEDLTDCSRAEHFEFVKYIINRLIEKERESLQKEINDLHEQLQSIKQYIQ